MEWDENALLETKVPCQGSKVRFLPAVYSLFSDYLLKCRSGRANITTTIMSRQCMYAHVNSMQHTCLVDISKRGAALSTQLGVVRPPRSPPPWLSVDIVQLCIMASSIIASNDRRARCKVEPGSRWSKDQAQADFDIFPIIPSPALPYYLCGLLDHSKRPINPVVK
ncbi:hypothetical protein GGTG_05811 [Gaeumannomyces tritici R3-111a-1]|uniref:Uncharacterized protein n=1 Tax=Gaeumannomyces tritici (strain R3-111a-1) TaxID=644352 RepID=J3NX01_GAET3|nr:hypothetical protein GGTG_05811 [Gaeumannomyces tritici R3-111a-1]EJT75883.1 hypothetical protein GGTG_05811 [Gaeumannomyces tritici R3-111a-1]